MEQKRVTAKVTALKGKYLRTLFTENILVLMFRLLEVKILAKESRWLSEKDIFVQTELFHESKWRIEISFWTVSSAEEETGKEQGSFRLKLN